MISALWNLAHKSTFHELLPAYCVDLHDIAYTNINRLYPYYLLQNHLSAWQPSVHQIQLILQFIHVVFHECKAVLVSYVCLRFKYLTDICPHATGKPMKNREKFFTMFISGSYWKGLCSVQVGVELQALHLIWEIEQHYASESFNFACFSAKHRFVLLTLSF